jgi:MFS family permease
MALFATGLVMSAMSFGPAILANRVQQFGVSKTGTGMVFMLPLLLAWISPALLNYLSKKIHYRVLIAVALALSSISFLLMGPSEFLGFPNTLFCMGMGLVGMGLTCGFVTIAMFPEITEYSIQNWKQGQD